MASENKVLVIDNDLRTIKLPTGMMNIGVAGDKEVTRLYFKMPRYYGGFDLGQFAVSINYFNAIGEGDVALAEDIVVSGDGITFSWLIDEFMTLYSGAVRFSVHLEKKSGTVAEKEFNTTYAQSRVLENLNPMSQVPQVFPSVVELWKQDLLDRFDGRIDNTLKYNGMAADAGVTGSKIKKLEQGMSSPFNFKGSRLYSALPTSGINVNDTYYCTDKKCRYTWNGSGWYQSSMNESEYADELAAMSEQHNKYRGSVHSGLGYTTLAQCLKQGVYMVHTSLDLPHITDKPKDVTEGGMLYVDVMTVGNSITYYQTYSDRKGREWRRVFNNSDAPASSVVWNSVKELYRYPRYHGMVYTDNGYMTLGQCVNEGYYMVHGILDIPNITDMPKGASRGGVLYVDEIVYGPSNSTFCQNFLDAAGNSWRRFFDNQSALPNVSQWVKTSVDITKDIIPLLDSYIPPQDKYFFLDDLRGVYETPSTIEGGSTSDAVNLVNSKVNVIYDVFDILCSKYPNYITKQVLGTVNGLDINQYTFDFMRIENKSSYVNKKIKILLSAGIHGYEQGSSWCAAQFFKLLCEDVDNDISKFVRHNVEFRVVPVSNPYGFEHNTRKNANGVDVCRNFDLINFPPNDNPDDEYYPGPNPNSEVETQILSAWLHDNLDAEYFIEYHNIANGYPLLYLYSDSQVRMCNSVFATLTDMWRSKYTGFPTDRLLGYANQGTETCMAKYAIEKGLRSFVLETPWIMPVVGKSQYDKMTTITGIDVLANTLVAILKSYK